MKLKVFGSSDDNVCLEGDISDEFGSYSRPTYLQLNDGSIVKAEYIEPGIWRVDVEHQGAANIAKTQVADESDGDNEIENPDPDAPPYSDVLTLQWSSEFKIVQKSDRPIQPLVPRELNAMAAASEIVIAVEDKTGCNFDSDDARAAQLVAYAIILPLLTQ